MRVSLRIALVIALQAPAVWSAQVIGGCLVEHVRDDGTASAFDASLCNRLAQDLAARSRQVPSVDIYMWAMPYLNLALDNAERALCGSVACLPHAQGGDLIVTADGYPNAFVQPMPGNHFRVVVSAGLIDFVEQSAWAALQEAKTGKPQMHHWLNVIDSAARHSCTYAPPEKFVVDDLSPTSPLRTLAQASYMFILGHELAHLEDIYCGASAQSAVQVEMACDRRAMTALFEKDMMVPPPVLLALLGVSHYLSLHGEQFGRLYWPAAGLTLREALPATDFVPRVKRMAADWRRVCGQPPTQTKVGCRSGWQHYYTVVTGMTDLPQPIGCLEARERSSQGPSSLSGAPTAQSRSCSVLRKAMADAKQGFRSLRTSDVSTTHGGDKVWNGLSFEQHGCEVWQYASGPALYAYRCGIYTGASTEAKERYAAAKELLRSCFSDAEFGESESPPEPLIDRFSAVSGRSEISAQLVLYTERKRGDVAIIVRVAK